MNIKLYTAGADYTSYRAPAAPVDKPAPTIEKAAGNYDKVTIRGQQALSGSSGFARTLAKTLNDKLDEGVSQGEVQRLQAAVASGAYQPDARRIAERMLGYR